ncbi:sugar phosphate isomerase/epimerase family protein [Paenibacillus sp. UNC451MF]|uniref:sugar phosphate isomerase/epimerase family protein n=1 Tax=Paenibacillus sp. UNC451MF TaxID=1449063 RepID=UPI000490F20E|nr:sugar phosphate isomerase/epimerase family protein [Paenibacillus sp. UNC451MF]
MSGLQERSYSLPAIGCCLTAGSFMPQSENQKETREDPVDLLFDGVCGLLHAGYDYAELTVGSLAQLTEDEYERLLQKLKNAGIVIPVFNSFIPPTLKLTGPEVQQLAVEQYVEHVMKRIHAVGGELIIFGSGAARTVPEGFAMEQGIEQLKKFLIMCDRYAAQYELVVAIEPLNSKESNVINKVEEALDIAQELNLRHIRVLADAYHMYLEQESPEIVKRAINDRLLAHVHYAEFDRSFPIGDVEGGVDLTNLFSLLRDSRYEGRVSAECMTESAATSSEDSLGYVKSLLTQLHGRGE